MSTLYKVGQIAQIAGKSVRAIHLYEEMGIIRSAARTEAGYRLFHEDTLKRLTWIADLQALGMSLTEIRRMVGRLDET